MNNTTSEHVLGESALPPCFYLDRFQIFRARPLEVQFIANCTLNAFLSVTAILGNAMILYALPKSSSLRPPSKVLLFNLALSDFAVGLVVQPLYVIYKVAQLLNNHAVYCIAGTGFHVSANVFSAVSFLTVVVIALDRLLALQLGITYRSAVSLRRVVVVILSLWALTSLWVFTWLRSIRLYQVFNISATSVCLVVSLVTYGSLWLQIRHLKSIAKHRPNTSDAQEVQVTSNRRLGNYKRSVISMFYIYILLLVCYVPYLVMFIVLETSKVNATKIAAISYSITILFANATFNPFLYCWRIREIRKDVFTTISYFCLKK